MSILDDILGPLPGGAIARRMGANYEYRPQQMELARSVENAFATGRHLMAEAGTGVGKSFAYLIPAIDYAVKNRKRVIISTHTISLQEQLIEKDIPLIRSVYGDEFTAVLVKGRSNYLCLRRLEQARLRQGMLFDTDAEVSSLVDVQEWAETTTDGSLADLKKQPAPGVWDKVCAEAGNCMGKKCSYYQKCHWQAAKRRMQSGNVLVVNHALFFSDLALRMAGTSYLPKYDIVVLDEAHTAEDVAGQHFGLKISESAVAYNLRTLYDPRRGRGMLSPHGPKANDAIERVLAAYEANETFFEGAIQYHEGHGLSSGRMKQPNAFADPLSAALSELSKGLIALTIQITDEAEQSELTSMANKMMAMAESTKAIIGQTMDDAVYWMEVTPRAPKRVSLHAAPVNIAEGLRQHLFNKVHSVVLTSATMCTARETKGSGGGGGGEATNNFDYVRGRLGMTDFDKSDTLAVGSPFDYRKQATLYLETGLPDPADRFFAREAAERIMHYLKETGGGAFVLFTSYRQMIEMGNLLDARLKEMGLPLHIQGQGVSRTILLDRFRSASNSVLFGTASFWQGVDVRGDTLRNVIIVKLPFDVPDEPLVEAKLEAIKKAGGNAFMEFSVPQAIIRLKQGFGRLIRSSTDTGIVVILDNRVVTKRYGKLFLDALPDCKRVIVGARDQQEW